MARAPTIMVRISRATHSKLVYLQGYYTDQDRPSENLRKELNKEHGTDLISLAFVVNKCADEVLDHIDRNRTRTKKGK